MKWLEDLIDQFAHQSPSQSKVNMLDTIFKDRLPEIMGTAVIEYLKTGGDWFPTVRQLSEYVDAAQIEHDRGVTNIRKVWEVQSLSQAEQDELDEKMYAWEMARNGFEL